MGCFNKSCGLTQMPICYNDETVTFVILKNDKWGKNRLICNIDDLWSMIPIPIYGKYNDYGGQEDHAGQEHKYAALRELFPDVTDLEPDEYKKLTSPFENNEALNDSTHCGKFAIKRRFSTANEVVKTIMFSRPTYDKFVANHISYDDGELTPIDDLVKALEVFDELSKPLIQEALDKFVTDNNIEKEVTFDTFLTFHPISHIGYVYIDALEDKWSNPAAGVVRFYTDDGVMKLKRMVSSGAVTHKELIETYLLQLSMSALGKIIQPQMTTGQDRLCPYHAFLIDAMNDTLLRIKAEEDADNEDFPEYEG